MQDQPRRFNRDLATRLAGLGSMLTAGLAVAALVHFTHQPPGHLASPVEVALAFVTFVGAAIGGAMLVLGAALFAQVQTPPRRRNDPAPLEEHVPPAPAAPLREAA